MSLDIVLDRGQIHRLGIQTRAKLLTHAKKTKFTINLCELYINSPVGIGNVQEEKTFKEKDMKSSSYILVVLIN